MALQLLKVIKFTAVEIERSLALTYIYCVSVLSLLTGLLLLILLQKAYAPVV